MAKVAPGSATADLRGRLGAIVISSNAQGGYVKSFTTPTLRRTPAQQEQRALFARYSAAYAALDAGTRQDWIDCAALPGYERYDYWGNPYTLTGLQLYVGTQLSRSRAGAAISDTPPLSDVPDPPPTVTATIRCSISGNASTLELTSAYGTGVEYVLLDVCYRIPQAAVQPSGEFRPWLTFQNPDAGPIDPLPPLVALVGYVPLAANVFAQVYSMAADGRLSLPVSYHWNCFIF